MNLCEYMIILIAIYIINLETRSEDVREKRAIEREFVCVYDIYIWREREREVEREREGERERVPNFFPLSVGNSI